MFFKIFKPKKSKVSIQKPDISEYTGEIFARQPRVALLSNGITASYLCDNGASFMLCEDGELTRRPYDLLEEAYGVFCYANYNSRLYCLSYAPEYKDDVEYEAAFSKTGVSYFARTPDIKLTTQVRLHSSFGGEVREYLFENKSEKDIAADIFILLSPFCGEAIEVLWDEESNALLLAQADKKSYMAIGFYENKAFLVQASDSQDAHELNPNTPSIKKGELALCFSLNILKSEPVSLHLIMAYGKTKKLALNALHQQRKVNSLDNKATPASPLAQATPEVKRLVKLLLPRILFSKRDSTAHLDYAFANNLMLSELTHIDKIKEDIPLVVVDVYSLKDKERINVYLSAFLILKRCFLKLCLVFLYDSDEEMGKELRKAVKEQLFESYQGDYKGEIKILSSSRLSAQEQCLLHAAACHIASRSLVRIELPSKSFIPLISKEKGLENKSEAFELILLSKDKKVAFIKEGEKLNFEGAIVCHKKRETEKSEAIYDISLKNPTDQIIKLKVACYNKLLFGSDRLKAQLIKGEYINEEGMLVLFNPIRGYWLAATSKDKSAVFCGDRADFLSGEWESEVLPPCYDPCIAAHFCTILKANEEKELSVVLAYADTRDEAISKLCILLGQEQGIDKKL